MRITKRMDRVLEHIGRHLDDKMTLEDLSGVVCLSKYHFHRLFKAHTGLSLHQYVVWLRLKRAAHQLLVEKKKNILSIALDAGFESAQAFARSFKKSCGQTPQEFRRLGTLEMWASIPFILHHPYKEIMMTVTLKQLPKYD